MTHPLIISLVLISLIIFLLMALHQNQKLKKANKRFASAAEKLRDDLWRAQREAAANQNLAKTEILKLRDQLKIHFSDDEEEADIVTQLTTHQRVKIGGQR